MENGGVIRENSEIVVERLTDKTNVYTNGETNVPKTKKTRSNSQRYGIKQSLLKRSVKYEPLKPEEPKLPPHVCTPCSRGRKVKVATNFCTVCLDKLCSDCTFQHNKFELLRQHKVVSVTDIPGDTSSANSTKHKIVEKCTVHGTKIIDKYCKGHDAVGCDACMALDHRHCLEPEYVTRVSQGLLKSNLPKEVKQAVHAKRKEVQMMKDKRAGDKKRLTSERDDIVTTITDMRKRINDIFDKIEREAIAKLHAKYDEDYKGIKQDMKKCDEAISSLDAAFKKLSEPNEAQLFVNIKRDAKGGLSQGDTAIRTVIEHLGDEGIVFTVDENINEWLNKLSALGKFDHEKTRLVGSFYAKIEGNMETDTNKTEYIINGLVNLPDGRTILADWGNKRLKMLDKSYYNICSHCDLPGAPFSICGVSPGEIAVSIRDEKLVQFISISDKKMTPSRKFKLEEYCRGIYHRDGEMFITCGGGDGEIAGQLRVYNMSGVLQRVYDEDNQGHKLFKSPKDILINNEGTRIYVADKQKGIITLSTDGRYLSTFKDAILKTPCGLTIDSTGNLFVIGYDSNNVIQIGSDGKKLSEVVTERDGIARPVAICCHESVSNRLMISMENSNEIKVFTLQEK